MLDSKLYKSRVAPNLIAVIFKIQLCKTTNKNFTVGQVQVRKILIFAIY